MASSESSDSEDDDEGTFPFPSETTRAKCSQCCYTSDLSLEQAHGTKSIFTLSKPASLSRINVQETFLRALIQESTERGEELDWEEYERELQFDSASLREWWEQQERARLLTEQAALGEERKKMPAKKAAPKEPKQTSFSLVEVQDFFKQAGERSSETVTR